MSGYLNSAKLDELCAEIGRENLPMLLDIFLGELKRYHIVLSGDVKQLHSPLKEICHMLKSNAASFGADHLCELANKLDAKARAGEPINTLEYRDLILFSIDQTTRQYQSLTLS